MSTNKKEVFVLLGWEQLHMGRSGRANDRRNRITPLWVAFTDSERLIGEGAKYQAAVNAERTIFNVKRLIGRKQPKHTLDMKLRMPLSRNLATKDAGVIASLNVARIITELVAAAIAHGLNKKDSEKNILVFHLGGVTFNVSILTISNDVVSVLAKSGDTHLGGIDIDQKIMEYFIKLIKKKHKKASERINKLNGDTGKQSTKQSISQDSVKNTQRMINTIISSNYLHHNKSLLDCSLILYKGLSTTNDLVQLKQNNLAIEIYYHKLKRLWDEYDSLEAPYMCVCACVYENGRINGEREQRKRLIQFLMDLDECYANVKGQILLMNLMPTIAKAYSLIRQEEKQREGSAFKNTPTVFSTQSNYTRSSYSNHTRFDNSRFRRNYSQGKSSSRNSNQGESSRRCNFKKGVICRNYGKEGHIKEECYKIVGYPVGHPLHRKYKPSNKTFKNNSQDNKRTVNMTMS
nr:luminal-binding protein 5 [Tanacetum cinerariifolium]